MTTQRLNLRATLAGATLALATALPLGALAADVEIKLAHPNVPDHPMGQGFEFFKKLVEERSNGEIEVTIFDSSKFGNFDSVVQGLQSGLLQMGSASTPNLAPFSKDFLIFDMPFLIPSYEAADLITDGEIGKTAARALEPTGILGMGYIEIGFRHNFNSTRSVETLADMEGMKIRSTPSKAHIATLQSLGANPTPIAWSEVYTALQQQTVDGIDIDLNLAWANNFHEVTDNLTLVGSLYSPHLVMGSQIWWMGLSPEHQELIETAFAEMQVFQRGKIRENEADILVKMADKGMTIVELSAEERAKFQEASQSVLADFESEIGADLIEKAQNTISDAGM
ncbi:TRAP transporter substrate-binding protein [Ruegeria sp. 2205SS24-7]|uniref:TRAP transporter substrate-binding protein n=1 Tax=Ruegeria discodermiae TaxID=3064389 RepID=UPI002741727B|nr:TRAP transporter substrate-binding protein [Ruegeria sp. 2205SS24-7]MDP5220579.1 TRAP transporter substrate-binding protein [Ruegeria sp. 2205SS24-7]